MKTNKLTAAFLLILLALAAYSLLGKVIDSTTTAQQAIVYTEPGRVDVNLSQANLNNAQAAQINQAVRRQNEADDGTAINVGARVMTGRGITDAEQVGTNIFSIYSACLPVIGALLVILGAYVMHKISTSKS